MILASVMGESFSLANTRAFPDEPVLRSTVQKVTGSGWFESEDIDWPLDNPISVEEPFLGHRCHFGFVAMDKGDSGFTGQGTFTDKDYRLKAILRIDSIEMYSFRGSNGRVGLYGTCKLYIDSKYSGEYRFRLGVGDEIPYDGTTVDKLSFHIDFDRDGDYWEDYIVSTAWPSLDGGQAKITHQK